MARLDGRLVAGASCFNRWISFVHVVDPALSYPGTHQSDVDYCVRRDGRKTYRMRFHSLHAGLLQPLETVDPFSRSRAGYLIRTDLRENTQHGIDVPGTWGMLRRDGMPSFIRALESRAGNTASRHLGL